MTSVQTPSQQFNIQNINGPAHMGGYGDINITISNADANALVDLIHELVKPEPSSGLLSNVKNILNAGKSAMDIIKMLITCGIR